MSRWMKWAPGVVALALLLAGCSVGTTSGNDAGIKDRAHGKRNVYDMPDQYPNVATVCIRGVMVAVTSDTRAPGFVIPQGAPYCKGLDGVEPRKLGG